MGDRGTAHLLQDLVLGRRGTEDGRHTQQRCDLQRLRLGMAEVARRVADDDGGSGSRARATEYPQQHAEWLSSHQRQRVTAWRAPSGSRRDDRPRQLETPSVRGEHNAFAS